MLQRCTLQMESMLFTRVKMMMAQLIQVILVLYPNLHRGFIQALQLVRNN
mgnify:CR=1 FL=1